MPSPQAKVYTVYQQLKKKGIYFARKKLKNSEKMKLKLGRDTVVVD